MSLARSHSVALVGVHATVIDIDVHIGGMPGFTIVGLPDTSLHESRDRVRAALLSSHENWPLQKITVSLSPASLPKRGSHFDLGIALAILAANQELSQAALRDVLFLGELALDGRLHPVRGVLPAVIAAKKVGIERIVLPEANVAEARLVPDMYVLGARSLRQVVAFGRGDEIPDEPATRQSRDLSPSDSSFDADMAEVVGQANAKFATEIAAAGHHHLLLHGPPGAGKTMLAQRLPTLMPDLTTSDALEVSSIHSVSGVLPADTPLIVRPPYVAPHHTSTPVAVVGGGSRAIRPGAASLAHRGVLFLDEAPEFSPTVLDSLRQPLESGEIAISRAEMTAVFPARFLLVLAQNPCGCGNHGSVKQECSCRPDSVRRYGLRVSGPIRDRIDVHVHVDAPSMADIDAGIEGGESSKAIAERVAAARERQALRLRDTPWTTNAELPGAYVRGELKLPPDVTAPVYEELRHGRITIRGADRALRVAWTIADLANHDRPTRSDVAKAVCLRTGREL